MGGASSGLVISRGVVELTLVSHWYGVTAIKLSTNMLKIRLF